MDKNVTAVETKHHVIGFVLSIVLTLAAYFLVTEHFFSTVNTLIAIGAMAAIQAYLQLYFFLDLGNEPKPRWNMMHFLFMLLVLVVIVGGSMWIMHHLNYNMMPPMDMHY